MRVVYGGELVLGVWRKFKREGIRISGFLKGVFIDYSENYGFELSVREVCVRSFIRLRIRARCSLLSNRTDIDELISGTVGSNVGNVTIASRKGVFNVGRFAGCIGGGGDKPGKRVGSLGGEVTNVRDNRVRYRSGRTRVTSYHTGVTRTRDGLFGPVMNYRVCITHQAVSGGRKGPSRDNCRLVILTGGRGKCRGLVGLMSRT